MRILLVNKFYYLRGGAERSVFDTERMLRAEGHEVIPFAMSDERNRPSLRERYFVDKVEFNREHSLREKLEIIPRVIYFRQARRRLERLLRREQVDLAHLHNIAHQISPSILDSLKKFGIPVVQTLHDYKLICPTYTMLADGKVCERCSGGRYYHAAAQRCNKGSLAATLLNVVEMYVHRALGLYDHGIDLFIAPSQFLRQKLLQAGIRGTPIVHLPNAIDARHYLPHYGDKGFCVYFGRLSPEKGVDILIRSMRGQENLRLLIIGDGLQRQKLEDLVRTEKLDNVEFLGPLYGEDLKKVVADALFVVLPSQCYENCPFSILESFAMGKPVIGSNIGGIPELISPGRDGLLVEPGDVDALRSQMRHLVENRESTIEMGRLARQKIENKYSPAAYLKGLMRAYQMALGRSLSSGAGKDGERG